ncbi:hypothetical protein K2X05_04300 [bacterium]|nr:hypothetical protein [bacterium]
MCRFLFLVLFFSYNFSLAAIPGLSGHYNKALVFAQINAVTNFPLPSEVKSCQTQILNMTADNQLTIFVGFGYMDYSPGQDFVDSATALYGHGDVLDPDAFDAFSNALMRSCSTGGFSSKNQAFACGFKKGSGGFTKTIKNRFTGKNTQVFVKLASSAYTSNDQQNKTTYADKQQQKSQNAHAQFLNALKSYDAVLYLGHARSGGGPDFYPPRLLKSGHVDYGYYKANKPGLKSMLQSLKSGAGPDLIGLLACKSTGLFSSAVQKQSSHSALITANSLFDFDDLVPTGFTVLEALISQRCNENFSNVVENHLPSDLLTLSF